MLRRQLGTGQTTPVHRLDIVGQEERVIAEPVLASGLEGQLTGPLGTKDLTLAKATLAAGDGEGHGADETPLALPQRNVAQLAQQQLVVGVVVALRTGPACGSHPGAAVQGVDLDARVIGQGRQTGPQGALAGLDDGIALEGALGLGGLGVTLDVGQADDVEGNVGRLDDGPQLTQLLGVVRGEDERGALRAGSLLGGGRHGRADGLLHHLPSASAAACMTLSSEHPLRPRSSRTLRVSRSKGTPSAVPWTSMKSPLPATTMFMSVSAVESSV